METSSVTPAAPDQPRTPRLRQDAPVSTPLLSDVERHRLLIELNDTAAHYPAHICVHQLFEAQVARDPHRIALASGSRSLTYGELNARSNRLARQLRRFGVGPDRPAGICTERSFAMVTGILAVLKAGGAYLPLVPDQPGSRVAYMLEESAATVVLHDTACKQVLAAALASVAARPQTIDLDADVAIWSDEPATDLDREALGLSSENLAYLLFTSGSTGLPKGVMTEHRALVNRLTWMQSAYQLDAQDVVIQKTPFNFDVSVWEFFWPLCWGARLAIAEPGTHRDPERLSAIIREEGVTVAHFVPSMLTIFLQHASAGFCDGLKRVICSGEALHASLLESFHRSLPRTELHNLYGPTEAAIDVTAWTSTRCLPEGALTPPIGRPISNTRIYVLDERLEPVPLGTVGEIHIGGAGVARGYLNRPELTAERFLDSPFVEGDRLYKTGDLGRYLADGNLEYLGRNDLQVKLRGYRIELGEIEVRLRACPGVGEAAVWLSKEALEAARIIAAFTTAGCDTKPDSRALRDMLTAVMPAYMVPSAFIVLPAMPLTANGKLDRRALSDLAPREQDGAIVPAGTTYEEGLVCSIVAELLGIPSVGVEDNFFHVGGNSMLAARLAEQLRQRAARDLPIRAIFEYPTLGRLAAHLAGSNDQARIDAFEVVLPIRRDGTEPPLFCLHPVGGLCWPYTALLPFTRTTQPIYGIQSLGHRPEDALAQSVDEMVEACVAPIRRIAPAGPVRLLGWSFGGILAHLVATRLQAEGGAVDPLILFDAYPPVQRDGWSYADDPRTDGLWRDLAFALDLDLPPDLPDGSLDGTFVMALARKRSHPLAALSQEQFERFAAVMANNTRHMSDIRFERFDGDIVFVAASLRPPGFKPDLMSPQKWHPYCNGIVRKHVIRSTHNRMLSPESLRQIGFLADIGLEGRAAE